MKKHQIFISYSGHDSFEATLLQYVIENTFKGKAVAWTYQRDQKRSEKEIAKSIRDKVRSSAATIFIVSPTTIQSGASQWMELAYSDAYEIPTYILLHHLDFQELKRKEKGIPPLLLSCQCNPAKEWKSVINELKKYLKRKKSNV